jgi:indolepyruvate decarboxylase
MVFVEVVLPRFEIPRLLGQIVGSMSPPGTSRLN